jgi:Lar family restriction alleviation protein
MTDRTEAMDNLIAQDADLIDINNKDSAVLLPCPFCGGVQIEVFHHIDRGWGASWHVECVAEECGNSTCHHDTEATAIAAWNKRQPTQSDALQAENEQLRHDLERQMTIANEQLNEAERLRVEVKAQYDRGYYDGRKMDAMEERAKIVAWCRNVNLDWCRCADAIEAGEHLK